MKGYYISSKYYQKISHNPLAPIIFC
jgi:hypothetical protein